MKGAPTESRAVSSVKRQPRLCLLSNFIFLTKFLSCVGFWFYFTQTGVARLLFTMPHHCAVPGCTSNSKSSPGLAFHCFPSDTDLRKLWLARIRRDEVAGQFQVTSSTRVCGNHFPPSAYFLAGHAGERKRERKTERKSSTKLSASIRLHSSLLAAACESL